MARSSGYISLGHCRPCCLRRVRFGKTEGICLAFKYLKYRIDLLLATPLSRLDKMAAQKRLAEIGRVECATPMTGTKE
jgi:hypothetical protein